MGRATCAALMMLAVGLLAARAAGDATADQARLSLQPEVGKIKTDDANGLTDSPFMLSAAPGDDQGVYTMPTPPTKENGTNLGGVDFDISVVYGNHYVYRGVDHSIGTGSTGLTDIKATTLNLEVNAKMEFDLGRFPHPFVGIFANVYDADPISRFQEIRPYFGVDWTIKPFTLEIGDNTYIYPDRKDFNTAEAYTKLTMNDAFLFHREKPLLSPYIYGAYDYDKSRGTYLETGVSHDFAFEDLGLTITPQADAAYIIDFREQFVFINTLHDTGFQHFDVGVKTSYSLNRLFNLSNRFGEFDLLGLLFFTGKLDSDLTANNVVWGGAGIAFKY